jgi:hypothetical protein
MNLTRCHPKLFIDNTVTGNTVAEFKLFVILPGETERNYKIDFTVYNWCPEEIRNMCLPNPSRKLTCLVSLLISFTMCFLTKCYVLKMAEVRTSHDSEQRISLSPTQKRDGRSLAV